MTALLNKLTLNRWTRPSEDLVQDRFDELAEDRMRPISRPITRRS